MIKVASIFTAFLLALTSSYAQVDTIYVAPGDSFEIVAGPFSGSIQWQKSGNGFSWSELSGATDNTYSLIIPESALPGTSKYYKANVNMENCQFSSTIVLFIVASSGPCGGMNTVMDFDGNVYNIVEIGDQCWMAENLATTHYRNGDSIATGLSNILWQGATYGAYASSGDDPANDAVFGKLYNWYATADQRRICPVGWHIPTDDEWKILEIFLGMSLFQANQEGTRGTDQGGKMKSTGTLETGSGLWLDPNSGATNSSEFSGLPAGFRYYYGDYDGVGDGGFWWSSTENIPGTAWYRVFRYNHAKVDRYYGFKPSGVSVRCLRD